MGLLESDIEQETRIAAKDFPDADIRIVDTQTIAGGLGVLVLEAYKMASQGNYMDKNLIYNI
jgi:fatty acid-binding protein DegV